MYVGDKFKSNVDSTNYPQKWNGYFFVGILM